MLEQCDDTADTAGSFESIARKIARCGYRVVHLPALVDQQQSWMVTYNNVLIDCRGGSCTVYMPVYRIPNLDQAAEAIYRNLGFEVKTVDVSGIYQLGGALRCIVNVTRRRPSCAVHQQPRIASQGNQRKRASRTSVLVVPGEREQEGG